MCASARGRIANDKVTAIAQIDGTVDAVGASLVIERCNDVISQLDAAHSNSLGIGATRSATKGDSARRGSDGGLAILTQDVLDTTQGIDFAVTEVARMSAVGPLVMDCGFGHDVLDVGGGHRLAHLLGCL